MENYEQKYKEALAKARVVNPGTKDYNIVTAIFPELKEEEYKRIKNNIIKLLRFVRDTYHQYSDECNEAIEWIEKKHSKFKVDDWSGNEGMREGLIHFLEGFKDTTVVRKWIDWLKECKQIANSKTDWSEEDEIMFTCLWGLLNWVDRNDYSTAKPPEEYIHWLQSLKQRLNGYE